MGTVEKIRVCHLASGDLWAGAEVQLATLISGLTQYQNIEVSVILFNDGVLAERLKKIGIPVWIIDENIYNSFMLTYKTHNLLKNLGCDILHSHRYKENILGALARYNTDIKLQVCTIHGLAEPFTGFQRIKASFYKMCEYYIGRRRIDKVIAVSEDIKNKLSTRYQIAKLMTIHNGIDIEEATGTGEIKARSELGIDDDQIVIGTVGRLTPVKGYEYLIKAFKTLCHRHDNLLLMIIGDGPERHSLETLANELNISENILFYGFTENVSAIMRLFDIFVLSSLHEGISISLLEALALGIPVVVTAVGGTPEVVTHNKTGLLITPRNEDELAAACDSLIIDPEFRKQLGNNGRDHVIKDFTKEAMAAKVVSLYEGLCFPSCKPNESL